MSLFFLIVFISMLRGDPTADTIANGIEFCMVWALFSIADAQWISMLFKK